jgi:hypothetical protein
MAAGGGVTCGAKSLAGIRKLVMKQLSGEEGVSAVGGGYGENGLAMAYWRNASVSAAAWRRQLSLEMACQWRRRQLSKIAGG